MEDIFTIANKNFKSRLIVGTGKYKNFEETAKQLKLLRRYSYSCCSKSKYFK